MPKTLLFCQQHRQTVGNHTKWGDRRQKNQTYQDNYIQHLAKIPGRHTKNVARQDTAHATLQLIAILASIRNCNLNPVVTHQHTNELKTSGCLPAAGLSLSTSIQKKTANRSNYLPEDTQQNTFLRQILKQDTEQVYLNASISERSSGRMYNSLKKVLLSVSNVFQATSQFVSRYDPLKFPMAAAYSLPQKRDTQNVERFVLEDEYGKILNSSYYSYAVTHSATDCNFATNFQNSLMQYYENYYVKYPKVAQIILSNFKQKIKKHLHLEIDPNNARIVKVCNLPKDEEKEKSYCWQQFVNKTLTEWFTINFNRNLPKHAPANIEMLLQMDNKTILIDLSLLFIVANNINIYNPMKKDLIKSLDNKHIHIKKYFIDFICHLELSKINDEAVNDVLNGVGLLSEKKVNVSLLDIHGYTASTAFCFRSKSRMTIYFPESDFKFLSFQNKTEMREWLSRAWSQESQRNMIGSHFPDSSIFKWFSTFHDNFQIATEQVYIRSEHFFEYLFTHETMLDLAGIVKLGIVFRKNMWEKMTNIPNFTSLFSSLSTHLQHLEEVQTYQEKSKEWCAIKRSALDTIALSMLDKIIKFPHKEGYDFIYSVIKGTETADLKSVKPKLDSDGTEKKTLFWLGRKYLIEFYEDYNSKCLELKMLASSVLKEKIRERFHLDLDPDTVRFMRFDNANDEEQDDSSIVRVHYSPARENKTLTEWLFTNFNAETQDNLQDMDSMCGIYDISVWKKTKYRVTDELKIKPTDFIQLVYDIDFYNYAKNKLTKSFEDRDVHIKKYFFDFVNHLSESDITEEAVKDVQAGVGIGKGRAVEVSLFDIDGYSASNAFIFRNENGRVTLYFPGSDFKFISFRDDFNMRKSVSNACLIPENREMIASHFTIANRQDGITYSGVDTWLKSIAEDSEYYDRIAISPIPVEPNSFFVFLFTQIKEKTLSDLDYLVKSDAELRRDMWEEMIDASNILPNPVSPFLSLAMHIEHIIEADSYDEKEQELNKIESDAVNLVVAVTLSAAARFPEIKGYDFIDIVKKDVETRNINQAIGISEMRPGNPFQANSLYKDWLISQLVYDEAQVSYDITSFSEPLDTFLPLRDIKISNDLTFVDLYIKEFLDLSYHDYPYDVFYGLDVIPDEQTPVYIQRARTKIKAHLNTVRQYLRDVSYKLHTGQYEDDIKHFLSLLVDTGDERVIDQSYTRLKIMVMRTMEFLNKGELANDSNIVLISSKQVLNVEQPFLYKSAIIDPILLNDLPYGFVFKIDPMRRIHIVLDRMVDSPKERNIFINKDNLMSDTIAHETSHLSSNTVDVFYFETIKGGTVQENIEAMRDSFNYIMAHAESNVIPEPFKNYLEIIKQHFSESSSITDAAILRKIWTDPMLKANVIIENADTFALCVREIAKIGWRERSRRENRNISDRLVNFLLAAVFTAIRDHHINIQTECK